jgi:predicted dienelactone hydrolase
MRLFRVFLVTGFFLTAALAETAGIHFIEVPAITGGSPLIGTVWSPCAAPSGEVTIRGLVVSGVKDCPVAGNKLPLVVFSHGRTGWSGGHHDTAAVLADAGMIVVAINHPIDSSTYDMSRINDLAYLIERPSDIRRLIDFMLGAWPFSSKIDPKQVGFFGFSRGGYTGIVLAGGNPNSSLAMAFCGARSTGNPCVRIRNNEFPSQGYVHDARIRAAVIADPAPAFFFGQEDLKDITIPLQLWASEHGGRGASAEGTTAINNALPSKADYRIVQNAAHFAFLAPCSPAQTQKNPDVCVDAPSFDRVAFHDQFNADVLAFFRDRLSAAGKR